MNDKVSLGASRSLSLSLSLSLLHALSLFAQELSQEIEEGEERGGCEWSSSADPTGWRQREERGL